jgi:pyocin large subunit-like protein
MIVPMWVGFRERGAAVALAALPRLQLELTPLPGTPVCSTNKTRWCE